MQFEKFTHVGKSFQPAATISTSGLLSFNEGAKHHFKLADFSTVVLYFEPESKVIGIELTNEEGTEGAMKLRNRETGADVAIKSFLTYYGISCDATMKYPLQRDTDQGMLLIVLDTPKRKVIERPTKSPSPGKSDSATELGAGSEEGLDNG